MSYRHVGCPLDVCDMSVKPIDSGWSGPTNLRVLILTIEKNLLREFLLPQLAPNNERNRLWSMSKEDNYTIFVCLIIVGITSQSVEVYVVLEDLRT